jgi:hypothetical protein
MTPWMAAGVALALLLGGGVLLGWQGVIFAMTVLVFWLSVQIAKLMRVMKQVGAAPAGQLASAAAVQARLKAGMPLARLLELTGSMGTRIAGPDKTYAWQDATGDRLELRLEKGRLASWQLLRRDVQGPDAPAP